MKVINYTDTNIEPFIKEHCKDFETSALTVKIKNCHTGKYAGRHYRCNPYGVGSLIVIRIGKRNTFPLEVKLYKRKGLQETLTVNSKEELTKYMFLHEFMHHIQYKTTKIYAEAEAETYAISNFRGK